MIPVDTQCELTFSDGWRCKGILFEIVPANIRPTPEVCSMLRRALVVPERDAPPLTKVFPYITAMVYDVKRNRILRYPIQAISASLIA